MTIERLKKLAWRGLRVAAGGGALAFSGAAFPAATIVIVNGDPVGVGFNDLTLAAPVGGNTGTTLGAQRLNAFQAAADKWGATLTSSVPIRILATWEALTCTSGSAVVGSAGAILVYRDFSGAIPATWYSKAQANKMLGAEQDPGTADIRARFNINLGNPGCLDGRHFYLGLDNNHGNDIDLVTVLQHEFGHGLGFQTYTNGATGSPLGGFPSIWDHFLMDTATGKLWSQMTNAERAASAIRTGKLAWSGPIVAAAAPTVLAGTPQLTVSSPASVAGGYPVGKANFGPALNSPGVTGEVRQAFDSTNSSLVCNALSPAGAAAISGKIALVDRGTCNFPVKVKNLQNAGAIGAIIADNAPGSPPAAMPGSDPTITIPSVQITQADGTALKNALQTGSRLRSGMMANLGLNMAALIGADSAGQVLMYAPSTFSSGSSVSHWDTSASPNQLMEPNINSDLTHEIMPPNDLTLPLLQDIGWTP
jgi:hypothetical protein